MNKICHLFKWLILEDRFEKLTDNFFLIRIDQKLKRKNLFNMISLELQKQNFMSSYCTENFSMFDLK